MKLPNISGIIDRRILANYRIDPDVMAALLPPPFQPWCVGGFAIAGICLIRLKNVRPTAIPIPWGIGSENAAHRIAVQWETDGKMQRGVYIPRRDTDSWLNSIAGGRVFPGLHHHAKFSVKEINDNYRVEMQSDDGQASIGVAGKLASAIPDSSLFPSIESASQFFEDGSVGYSDTLTDGKYDGLELKCQNWHVDALEITEMSSSYFDDPMKFPPGSITFDCALLMHQINHQWHSRPDLCC
ncbi:hypothetical protein LF1_42060 [Rubripirellula obstinata]|uniref:DUF2071 domain-containing protein n=1 Tax=Rubripirellula obstinata TaxID=406547 RepID=A0A5B1CMX4_9BACT|nr:DUF2071 domain-containing protein [Rubripirellula obstinata]KAA1261651.1 hypothetical protein LF1_42060 [Rubripirellula obstinata]